MRLVTFHHIFQWLFLGYFALHYYLARWLGRYFSFNKHQSRKTLIILFLLALSFPAAEYFERLSPGGFATALVWLGSVWLGAMFIWAATAFITDIAYLGMKITGAGEHIKKVTGKFSLAVSASLVIFAVWQGYKTPGVVSLDIALKNLSPQLNGFTIVQVSDTHMSHIVSLNKFRNIADTINRLNPDLVVLTGDIIDSGFDKTEEACEIIKTIKSRYGIAGVLGNHDSFSHDGINSGLYEKCGIHMLRGGKYEPVKGLQVAGVDDIRRNPLAGKDLEKLFNSLDPANPVIFLSHQPSGFEKIYGTGSGLILSGHTHRGQIFPFGLMERPLFKYFYGLYKEGDYFIYVTAGAGTWGPPMRLFAPSEIPLFILHPQGMQQK